MHTITLTAEQLTFLRQVVDESREAYKESWESDPSDYNKAYHEHVVKCEELLEHLK